ncbi:hypothetical protein BH18THE2_BH18THE2_32110 [soil metagenome]
MFYYLHLELIFVIIYCKIFPIRVVVLDCFRIVFNLTFSLWIIGYVVMNIYEKGDPEVVVALSLFSRR